VDGGRLGRVLKFEMEARRIITNRWVVGGKLKKLFQRARNSEKSDEPRPVFEIDSICCMGGHFPFPRFDRRGTPENCDFAVLSEMLVELGIREKSSRCRIRSLPCGRGSKVMWKAEWGNLSEFDGHACVLGCIDGPQRYCWSGVCHTDNLKCRSDVQQVPWKGHKKNVKSVKIRLRRDNSEVPPPG